MKKKFLQGVSSALSMSVLMGSLMTGSFATTTPLNATATTDNVFLLKLNDSQSRFNGKMIDNPVNDSGCISRLRTPAGTAMLPLRFVCEQMGYVVGYNFSTGNTTVTDPVSGDVIELFIGTKRMVMTKADGSTQEITAPFPSQSFEYSTYIPLRALLNAFGASVEWSNEGYAVISNSSISTAEFNELITKWGTDDVIEEDKEEEEETPTVTAPPYPFWKNYTIYTGGEKVYYKGKIYTAKWWTQDNAPGTDAVWELVGDAEWTVPENPDNYTSKDDGTGGGSSGPSLEIGVPSKVTDSEIVSNWGGINAEYSSASALKRLETCLSESYYDELFPLRFGSTEWKKLSDSYYSGANRQNQPDYYSYDNLKQAISELADLKIKIEWYADSEYCYRIIRLDKTAKEETLIYKQDDWDADWNTSKTPVSKIVDFGTFLAEGSATDQKRELSAFLANIAHETGGGSVNGVYDQMQTGLYFNEELTHIGATSSGYTSSSYPSVSGVSYHGRGPIQTSWNYNYGQLSGIIYGDINVLLQEPQRLSSDGVLGFKAAIQFWMTPSAPKPSCHDVMTNQWTPTASAIAGGITQCCFGTTIMVINGGLEGNLTVSDYRVGRRAAYYETFAGKMNINISGEKVDTAGMTKF